MENIQSKRAIVEVVATDRHVRIKSDMKRVYPDVDHQFVEWYLGKSATKKLTEKAKKKDCGDLYPWIKSPTIFGGVLTHAMGTRNSYKRSGYQLSTTLPTSITGTVQIIIMNVPTHSFQEMWPEQIDG